MNARTFFIGTSWNKGSVSQQFVRVADELASRGHRAVLLVTGELKRDEDPDGNPAVVRWPHPRPVHLSDAAFLARLIHRERPACLIANFSATNVMLTVGAAFRVPVRVAWYHTMFEANAGNAEMPAWKFRALQLRKALVYRCATHLIANSEAARADMIQHFRVPAHRASVVFNSIPDPGAGIADPPARDPRELVCVSRLSPMKGQRTLIEALAKMRHRDVRVTFVGEGPERSELEALATHLGVRDRCTFAGYLGGPAVFRSYQRAAISVVPTLSEAFGLVNVESMALGATLVVSATGGSVEIARDCREALHFPPRDSAALARQLDRLLDDDALRGQLAAAGRARFEAVFEQNAAVRRLADFFEALA
jgi:glycosyltransferase involved in cell wall biosynthesis